MEITVELFDGTGLLRIHQSKMIILQLQPRQCLTVQVQDKVHTIVRDSLVDIIQQGHSGVAVTDHVRRCRRRGNGTGNVPVVGNAPVPCRHAGRHLIAAGGAHTVITHVLVVTVEAAGAGIRDIVQLMGRVLHHVNRSIVIRLIPIGIDQPIIIYIGEGIARGQQVRQGSGVAEQCPDPSGTFGVLESAAADLDGSVSGPIFP